MGVDLRVTCVLAAVLVMWVRTIQSDLDSTLSGAEDLQRKLDQNGETVSALVTAAEALYDDLAQQLRAASEDLAAALDAGRHRSSARTARGRAAESTRADACPRRSVSAPAP